MKVYDVHISATMVVRDGEPHPEAIMFDGSEILHRLLKSGAMVYALEAQEVTDPDAVALVLGGE